MRINQIRHKSSFRLTNKRKPKPINDAEPQYKCYVCGQHKPRSDFHNDFTKKRGVGSKCKTCGNIMASFRKEYKRKGGDPSEAYYAALDLIRGDLINEIETK